MPGVTASQGSREGRKPLAQLPAARALARRLNARPRAHVRQPPKLRYVSDDEPGLRRIRRGRAFAYIDAQGATVTDAETLLRIRALAIPPAYRDVWICATDDGHLQATARDARGRKQYRYHAFWRAVRDANKFERMLAFGAVLPRIRERVAADLAGHALSRERVLATVVSLLERTLVRVGNEEYARENGSFGLTTLREDHVEVKTQSMRFVFRGKSGVPHDITVSDRRLVRVVRRCLDIPGQELFRYLDDDGAPHPIGSSDVNDYIRELAGADFTAKDFRTWSASVLALEELAVRQYASPTQAKREVAAAVKQVAERLGNTPAVCRKCYIHPGIVEAYLTEGAQALPPSQGAGASPGLQPGEARLMDLLERRARRKLPIALLPQGVALEEALAAIA